MCRNATAELQDWPVSPARDSVLGMGDCSIRSVLIPPAVLCGVMMLIGVVTARAAGVDISGLFVPYLTTGIATVILCLLVFIFIAFAKLAFRLEDDPVSIVSKALRERLPLLVLPALVAPLFLIGFTSAKTAIPFLVGYTWDAFWANADRMIFGDDVWRITYKVLGTSMMSVWEWFYTVGWGAIFVISKSMVTLYASPRRIGVFFTGMFLTWIIGGWLGAYCFSAAGPVFAHLVEPGLTERFLPLREMLAANLGSAGAVRVTQDYLMTTIHSHIAELGGGISAMPSMHLGAVAIMVLAARGTKWFLPAILFWFIIFIDSGYFGYHYWLDGVAAAGIAWLCWKAAELYYAGSRDPVGRLAMNAA